MTNQNKIIYIKIISYFLCIYYVLGLCYQGHHNVHL